MLYILSVRKGKSWILERRHAIEEVPSAIRRRLRRSKSTQFADSRHGITGYRIDSGSDCNLVVVIGRALAGENVRSFIADIAYGQAERRSNLPLNCCIPLIDGGQPLNQGACSGTCLAVDAVDR